jgi:hypothetical protein
MYEVSLGTVSVGSVDGLGLLLLGTGSGTGLSDWQIRFVDGSRLGRRHCCSAWLLSGLLSVCLG